MTRFKVHNLYCYWLVQMRPCAVCLSLAAKINSDSSKHSNVFLAGWLRLTPQMRADVSAEVDSDCHAIAAACELLDILLDSDTLVLDDSCYKPHQKRMCMGRQLSAAAGMDHKHDHDQVVPARTENSTTETLGTQDRQAGKHQDTSAQQESRIHQHPVTQQGTSTQHVEEEAKPCQIHSSHTEVPVELARRLAHHLVQLLKQAERSDTLICCIVCLSRLHTLEGEPPSSLAPCMPDETDSALDEDLVARDAHAPNPASASPADRLQSGSDTQLKRRRGCHFMVETQCSCAPSVSALWSVLSDALAVRRLVSASVTVISGGLVGPFWPHLAAALTVLTWVAAGLARAAGGLAEACNAVRAEQHSSDVGVRGLVYGPARSQHKVMHWHRVCARCATHGELVLSLPQWRDSATAFVGMVRSNVLVWYRCEMHEHSACGLGSVA